GDTKPGSAAASTSEKTSSGTVTAIGRRLIDALKDKYLAPLARSLAPDRSRELVALADEEEEVAWVGSVLAAAEIPPIPATLGDPHQEAPQTPESDADREAREKEDAEAKARAETLREEAALVRDHANRAREAFSNQDAEGALAAAVEALDALERILELEPKAPISPEERLQRLVAQEKEAREAARGLETLEGETLDLGAAELGASQREAGKEAEEIATELEKRSSDERVVAAVGKVRDGSLAVFASAESLDRREPRPAGESIERAIALFEEALELLAREGESQDDQRERQNEELEQDDPSSRQAQPSQDSYTLSPRDARREIEEMDRKRRREEAKLFFESPGITVDKDW
ncbi:MAG TPA: hypothetical protein VK116_10015, partial [Planctomycetota bacterium]|nr:hypothetical protein [Planctomycetota bacterium]